MRELFKHEGSGKMKYNSLVVHADKHGEMVFYVKGLLGRWSSIRLGRTASKELAEALTDELLGGEEYDLEGRFPIDPDC